MMKMMKMIKSKIQMANMIRVLGRIRRNITKDSLRVNKLEIERWRKGKNKSYKRKIGLETYFIPTN